MKTTIRALVLAAALGLSARAEAFPLLQLDIINGHYDAATQTIISSSRNFTLVAVLQPVAGSSQATIDALLAESYYISAAVRPQVGPSDAGIGSFTFDGTPYNVTSDMLYGTPPIEAFEDATADPGDLPAHGIFPTYFIEREFQFTSAQRTLQYDSALNTGGLTPTGSTTDVGYYMLFSITTNTEPYVIHFDMYDTTVHRCSLAPCDEDVNTLRAADSKHDAESSNVPEPASALLVGLGFVGAARALRRRRPAVA